MLEDHLENHGNSLDNNTHTVIDAQETKPDGSAKESIYMGFFLLCNSTNATIFSKDAETLS